MDDSSDLSSLSNEELEKIANQPDISSNANQSDEDLSKLSNEELEQIAGYKTVPKSENILYRAAKSIIESNRQAQAGASEFLRNPMGGTSSYMKGFSNPSSSEAFAIQFPRQDMEANPELMEDKNAIPSFLATLPHNIAGSTLDTMANPLQAAMGAGIGKYGPPVMQGIGKVGGMVGNAIAETPFGRAIGNVGKGMENVLTKASRLKYMDKIENAVYKAREDASPNFGKAIEDIVAKNPSKLANMSEIQTKLLSSGDQLIQTALQKSPELQNIATHPTGQISLKEAQNALNSLKSNIPKSVLQGVGKRYQHLAITDLSDDMSLAISKDFPEIQKARDAYGQLVNDFRSIRPKVIGDAAAKNLFADYNPLNPRGKEFMGGERSEEKFKRLVGEDLFGEAVGTRKAKVIKDLTIPTIVGGAAATYKTLKK